MAFERESFGPSLLGLMFEELKKNLHIRLAREQVAP
jgi:hypothetical protein